MACCDDLSGLAIALIIQDSNHLSKRNRLLPKSYRHTFAGDAASSEVPSLALIKLANLKQPYCVNWIWATACKDLTPSQNIDFWQALYYKERQKP